jgi:hypothetical protein
MHTRYAMVPLLLLALVSRPNLGLAATQADAATLDVQAGSPPANPSTLCPGDKCTVKFKVLLFELDDKNQERAAKHIKKQTYKLDAGDGVLADVKATGFTAADIKISEPGKHIATLTKNGGNAGAFIDVSAVVTFDTTGIKTVTFSAVEILFDDGSTLPKKGTTVQAKAEVAVITIDSIKATVKSIPPKTPRNTDGLKVPPGAPPVTNNFAAPIDLSFTSKQALPEKGPLPFGEDIFKLPKALVLFQNYHPVALEAATTPANQDVAFDAVQDPEEEKVFGKIKLTVKKTGKTTATLTLNGQGSFLVLAFIDANKNGKWDPGECGVMLPLILLHVTPGKDTSTAVNFYQPGFFTKNGQIQATGTPGGANPWIGFTIPKPNLPVLNLRGTVTVVGGGPKGQRGLDRVFAGWVQNTTVIDQVGIYFGGNNILRPGAGSIIPITNTAQAPQKVLGILPAFRQGIDPKPVPPPPGMSLPLLDAPPKTKDGGDEILISNPDLQRDELQLGQELSVTGLDRPAIFFPRANLSDIRQTLTFVRDGLTFFDSLVLWTNSTGGAAPTPQVANSVGFRSYVTTFEDTWNLDFQIAILPPGGGNANYTFKDINPNQNVSFTKLRARNGVAADLTDLEVRPPTVTASVALFFQPQ